MSVVNDWRDALARRCERRLLRRSVSIVGEDCWGGQVYRTLGLPYLTPIVGLWVEQTTYLDFIANLREPDAFELTFERTDADYPVGRTPYAQLHFMHYHSEDEAREKFARRTERIVWDNLFVKIDFGKDRYTDDDIERWNRLALPRSVALLPPRLIDRRHEIHHAVAVPDWHVDGVEIYYIAKHHFDMFHWLNTGKVRSTFSHRAFHWLLGDPRTPRRVLNRLRGRHPDARRAKKHAAAHA